MPLPSNLYCSVNGCTQYYSDGHSNIFLLFISKLVAEHEEWRPSQLDIHKRTLVTMEPLVNEVGELKWPLGVCLHCHPPSAFTSGFLMGFLHNKNAITLTCTKLRFQILQYREDF